MLSVVWDTLLIPAANEIRPLKNETGPASVRHSTVTFVQAERCDLSSLYESRQGYAKIYSQNNAPQAQLIPIWCYAYAYSGPRSKTYPADRLAGYALQFPRKSGSRYHEGRFLTILY